jgi:hypothetical protein
MRAEDLKCAFYGKRQWITTAVKDHTPQKYKFEFGLWALKITRYLIRHEFHKSLS